MLKIEEYKKEVGKNTENLFNKANKGEISFDFKLTKENEEILKELLNTKGLIHYMVETKEKDKLDLVEYKEYQELEQELQQYKSLYENEKDKNDTLIRIIKKAKEELKKRLTARDYSNHKYELFGREYLEELYDLLKEIK